MFLASFCLEIACESASALAQTHPGAHPETPSATHHSVHWTPRFAKLAFSRLGYLPKNFESHPTRFSDAEPEGA